MLTIRKYKFINYLHYQFYDDPCCASGVPEGHMFLLMSVGIQIGVTNEVQKSTSKCSFILSRCFLFLMQMPCMPQVSYTSENVVEGKQAAKEALQERLGLKKADLPMVGIITRLTHQKGIHLIKHAIWRTLERNGQVCLTSLSLSIFNPATVTQNN